MCNSHLRIITTDIVSLTYKEVAVRHQKHSSMFPSGISVTLRLPLSFCSFFFSAPIVRSYIASFSSVTNETKIKCKWKFIAAGDRRRFRTFKYFINFLLLASPSSLSPPPRFRGSHERLESVGDDRKSIMERNEMFSRTKRELYPDVNFFHLALRKMKIFAI